MKNKINFTCSFTDKFIELNKNRAEIHKNLGITFTQKDLLFITMSIDSYLESNDCKTVINKHKKINKDIKNIIFK